MVKPERSELYNPGRAEFYYPGRAEKEEDGNMTIFLSGRNWQIFFTHLCFVTFILTFTYKIAF